MLQDGLPANYDNSATGLAMPGLQKTTNPRQVELGDSLMRMMHGATDLAYLKLQREQLQQAFDNAHQKAGAVIGVSNDPRFKNLVESAQSQMEKARKELKSVEDGFRARELANNILINNFMARWNASQGETSTAPVGQMNAKLQTLERQLESVQTMIKAFLSKDAETQAELRGIKATQQQLHQTTEDLTTSIDVWGINLDSLIGGLRKQVNDLANKFNGLEKQIGEHPNLGVDLGRTAADLARQAGEIKKLSERLNELSVSEGPSHWQENFKRLEKQVTELSAQWRTELETTVVDMSRSLEGIPQEIDRLNQVVGEVAEAGLLATTVDRVSKAEEALAASHTHQEEIDKALSHMNADLDGASTQMRLDNLDATLQSMSSKLDSMEQMKKAFARAASLQAGTSNDLYLTRRVMELQEELRDELKEELRVTQEASDEVWDGILQDLKAQLQAIDTKVDKSIEMGQEMDERLDDLASHVKSVEGAKDLVLPGKTQMLNDTLTAEFQTNKAHMASKTDELQFQIKNIESRLNNLTTEKLFNVIAGHVETHLRNNNNTVPALSVRLQNLEKFVQQRDEKIKSMMVEVLRLEIHSMAPGHVEAVKKALEAAMTKHNNEIANFKQILGGFTHVLEERDEFRRDMNSMKAELERIRRLTAPAGTRPAGQGNNARTPTQRSATPRGGSN
jgi:hypothetical protein